MRSSSFVVLLLLAYFLYTMQDEIEDLILVPINATKISTVQTELHSIAKIIRLDILGNDLPSNMASNFEGYLQKKMKSNRQDPSLDHWGEPYQIIEDANEFIIWSNGPDKEMNTDDDIEITVPKTPR